MKKIIVTIDESKLKDPITEDQVKDTILDRIEDALDYGYWSELLWNGDYGEEYEENEDEEIPCSVRESVTIVEE